MPIALITFTGHKLKAFFSRFFPLSNYKGIVEQTESPPELWVADHLTASAVTFSLFELHKKYLEGSRRHINSSSSQIFSKIEDGKCFVTYGRTDGRYESAGNLRGTPLVLHYEQVRDSAGTTGWHLPLHTSTYSLQVFSVEFQSQTHFLWKYIACINFL